MDASCVDCLEARMLRKALFALGCVASALGMSTAAEAAPIIFQQSGHQLRFQVNPVTCDTGVGTCPGAFNATGSFSTSSTKPTFIHFRTRAFDPKGKFNSAFDVDFYSADINGMPFSIRSPDSVHEYANVGKIRLLPTNTLTISGYTGGEGVINGNIVFLLPEPAAWGFLLLGFGAIGTIVRRRKASMPGPGIHMA